MSVASLMVVVLGIAVCGGFGWLYAHLLRGGCQPASSWVFHELFHPAAHRSAQTRREQRWLPGEAPVPRRSASDVDGGRVVVRVKKGSLGPESS